MRSRLAPPRSLSGLARSAAAALVCSSCEPGGASGALDAGLSASPSARLEGSSGSARGDATSAAGETRATSAAFGAGPSDAGGLDAAQPSAKREKREVKLVFAGDLAMVDGLAANMVARLAGKPTPPGVGPRFPFDHVYDVLASADLAIGNLECVVSTKGTVDTWHNPFRAPLETTRVLRDASFDLVSLANNHSLDFGAAGYDDMRKNLEQGGLPHFGHGFRKLDRQDPVIMEKNGLRIGFLGYEDIPTKKAVDDVLAARPKVDLLVVMNHWGFEGDPNPIPLQRTLGRAQLDAGADLVVGTHAHVLQPTELYKGKLLAYGLGNFAFSAMLDTEQHRTGALLEVTLGPTGLVSHKGHKTRLDDLGAPRIVGEIPPPRVVP
jgi:poly-gamma-glutamate capsule biosynthesis protein CapA/YwtB (metallophosphatase superfamily)